MSADHRPRVHSRDLVRDWKLQTTFRGPSVDHVRYVSAPAANERPRPTTETWTRRRELGSGTYGTVWLEECETGAAQGQLRAVKEIRKGFVPVTAIDYERELEAVVKFSQDIYVRCFVKSLGWFENDSAVYIAMEYIEHGDLQQCLVRPFPEPEARAVAAQLVEGLQFMHNNGFAHRDLKPANILVLSKTPWWVKISDFGISKRLEESTALRTMQVGTRGYIAPEVIGLIPFDEDDDDDDDEGDDSKAYTLAVDIWALGEIIFRMMANEPSFVDARQLRRYVVRKGPFPVTKLESCGASALCQEFVAWAMAASASLRPTANAAAAHAWLQSWDAAAVVQQQLGSIREQLYDPNGTDNVLVGEARLRDFSKTAGQTPLALGQNADGAGQGSSSTTQTYLSDVASARWSEISELTSEFHSTQIEVGNSLLPEDDTYSIADTRTPSNIRPPETITAESASALMPTSLHSGSTDSPIRHQLSTETSATQSIVYPAQETAAQANRPSSGANTALLPNRRDLKSWWKGFKVSRKPVPIDPKPDAYSVPIAPKSGVFGVPLHESIHYANAPISSRDGEGNMYIYGYIPYVVGKCGAFLKENGTEVEDLFFVPPSETSITELRTAFNTPDSYGKGLVWANHNYSIHDVAGILIRYLAELPEPVIPSDTSESFRNPWRDIPGAGSFAVGSSSDFQLYEASLLKRYNVLIMDLHPLNRQLLFYLIDFLALFVSKVEQNKLSIQRLASFFQPYILSSSDGMGKWSPGATLEVVIFLIKHQEVLFFDAVSAVKSVSS